MRTEHSGITGKIVERELFGEIKQERRETPHHWPYYDYEASVILVKNLQPFDPTDPEPDFANAVHYRVAEQLSLDLDQLRFYTAINSPLDHYHGVDGWFELAVTGQRVTIDLTTNPQKGDYKANIIFTVPYDGLDRKVDKEQFNSYVEELVRLAVEAFKL